MTCERRYTPSAVAELQAVSLEVELRRKIQALVTKRRELPLTEYGSGFVDALDTVLEMFGEDEPVSQPVE